MLTLTHVSKNFGKFTAVHDISLSIPPGEIFGFLGPNGAGKTTTIKLIAGLMKPSEGSITIDGHDVHRDPVQAKQRLAYIPDEPYLYEKMTGRECLELIGNLRNISTATIRQRINQLVDLFGIDQYLDQYTEDYSHGTRQKFVFASAFLTRPALLLIDEPLVGLDPQHAHLVKTVLRQIATDNQVTIFMSTHTLSVAQEICDRIGIIHEGKLVACGNLQELQQLAHDRDGDLEELYLKLTGNLHRESLVW
ncbi:MAG TPA: ABC transporter ATP-binding protein [bacterium]|nr:ABC transporter ATP-binding protein [bacterium]